MDSGTDNIMTRQEKLLITDAHIRDGDTRRSMKRKDKRTTLDMEGVLDHETQMGELNV